MFYIYTTLLQVSILHFKHQNNVVLTSSMQAKYFMNVKGKFTLTVD